MNRATHLLLAAITSGICLSGTAAAQQSVSVTVTDLTPWYSSWSYGFARAVNDQGQAIGHGTGGLYPRGYSWTGDFATVLGDLGGGHTEPVAIDEGGWITGKSRRSDGSYAGFIAHDGALAEIGDFYPQMLNDVGQVVGYVVVPKHTSTRLYSVADGSLVDLGGLYTGYCYGWLRTFARDINNAGQVVGASSAACNDLVGHAFIYANGTMLDLGTLGGVGSEAYSVNDLGQVAGWANASDGTSHAVIWSGGTTLQPFAGWDTSVALHINDAGDVAGHGTGPDGVQHVLVKKGVVLHDLGPGSVQDLNQLGHVLGYDWQTQRSYFWHERYGKIPLPCLGSGGWCDAKDLNNAGQIVGWGNISDVLGDSAMPFHAMRWDLSLPPPTPEEQLSDLSTSVADLIASGSEVSSLATTLDATTILLNNGNTSGAAKLLQAFIKQTQAMVTAGRLASSEAAALTQAALEAIASIAP